MSDTSKRILLAVPEPAQYREWQSILESQGWQVDTCQASDPLSWNDCARYQVVIFEPAGDNPYHDVAALLEECTEHSGGVVLPVLQDASPERVINLIRLGVVDILLNPVTEHELIETVNRVAGHKSLYDENLAYSQQLEVANRELRENINILKMDQMAGRQVQKNLLPASPLVHRDYTIAHRIVPSLYLSGDFVGYNIIFDRYLLFYLADVSGHGSSSAFVTILLKFILRRILRRHIASNDVETLTHAPQGFIEHINRQMLATGLEKHLTMFAGAIDMSTSIFRYAIASQMPMPVLLADGKARYLEGKGKPVGLFEDVTWNVQEVTLPGDFALMVASDGLLEMLSDMGLAEQDEYLLKAVEETGGEHEALCRKLGLNSISEAVDDISLLTVVRRSKA